LPHAAPLGAAGAPRPRAGAAPDPVPLAQSRRIRMAPGRRRRGGERGGPYPSPRSSDSAASSPACVSVAWPIIASVEEIAEIVLITW